MVIGHPLKRPCADSLFTKIIFHPRAGRLQVIALNVVGANLPQHGQSGRAFDEGDDGHAAHFLELLDHLFGLFLGGFVFLQFLGEGAFELDVLGFHVFEQIERV